MVKLHLLTYCTEVQNLQRIRYSIYPTINFEVVWHIVFNTNILKDVDAEMLSELQNLGVKFYFKNLPPSSKQLYVGLNDVIATLDDGFIYLLHDNNLLYPNFYSDLYLHINRNPNKKVFTFQQDVNKKDFSGVDIRYVSPENMMPGKIDAAQYVIDVSLHKQFLYEESITAEGTLMQKLYKEHSDKFHFIHKTLCYYAPLIKEKKPKVPKVLYIGNDTPHLESKRYFSFEDLSLDVVYEKTDSNVYEHLVEFNPDAILTVSNDKTKHKNLMSLNKDASKKWINVPENTEDLGDIIYKYAMKQMLDNSNEHLVSYFTPIYNTKEKLLITYESLKKQTNNNWEWVLVNDSTDKGKTLKIAELIAAQDHRVKVYDFREKSNGIIGEVKYRAAALTRGKWLAELDHDDVLTEECTQYIIDAANKYPDAGFIYTDFVEVDTSLNSMTYPPGFALGYGKYKKVKYKTFEWDMHLTPNINPKTIRHIVSVPNHIRVWRRDVYFAVGGHNRYLSVADDYELIVRTFLHTKFVKVPKLGYIQFIYNDANGQNTHDLARADIQRRVRTIMLHYNEQIKKRFEELGIHDYVYEQDKNDPISVPSRFGNEEGYVNYIHE